MARWEDAGDSRVGGDYIDEDTLHAMGISSHRGSMSMADIVSSGYEGLASSTTVSDYSHGKDHK